MALGTIPDALMQVARGTLTILVWPWQTSVFLQPHQNFGLTLSFLLTKIIQKKIFFHMNSLSIVWVNGSLFFENQSETLAQQTVSCWVLLVCVHLISALIYMLAYLTRHWKVFSRTSPHTRIGGLWPCAPFLWMTQLNPSMLSLYTGLPRCAFPQPEIISNPYLFILL